MRTLIKENEIEYFTRNNLREHQQKLLDILKFFSSFCDENEIDYWLDGGGLLGLVRHDGMIPWDDDIDICVASYDYERCLNLLDNLCKDTNYFLYYRTHEKLSWCEYLCDKSYFYTTPSGIRKPVNIDIFPVKFISPNKLKEDIQKVEEVGAYVKGNKNNSHSKKSVALLDKKLKLIEYNEYILMNNVAGLDKWAIKGHGQFSPIQRIESSFIFPLNDAYFEGVKIKVPSNISAYLTKSYGNNYKSLPPLKSRKPSAIDSRHITNNMNVKGTIQLAVKYEFEMFYYKNKIYLNLWKVIMLSKQVGITSAIKSIFSRLKF